MNHQRVFTSIHAAYLAALEEVYFDYEYLTAPRGLPIREKQNYMFTIMYPENTPIVTKDEERNRVIARYTKKECELYDACTNKVADFAQASKFWNTIANPDGTINSAYGYLIWKKKSCGGSFGQPLMTPWEWAKNSLIADKDSRQAILRFSLPEHQWANNKDQVCTLHGNFNIRNNRLNLMIVMRSNDLMKGLVYDLPWFCGLVDRMLEDLKPTYPDLEKGTYTHLSHSMHIYQPDEDAILKMLGVSK